MKQFFPIAPWEYPSADFAPLPHAKVRHEIAGKKRTFWLKMREGIIYFREGARSSVFAIPRLFDADLANNPTHLVREWKREVECDNYGAFIISHRLWPQTLASANYCIILRTNGSGWIKEHFDETWLEFSGVSPSPVHLWFSKPSYGDVAAKVVNQTKRHFLDRTVDASHFQTNAPHWSHGGPDEMLSVLRSAAQLWIPPEQLSNNFLEWNCKSNSAFLAGSVMGNLVGSPCYRFNLIWDIAKWHYGFMGVEWKKASDHPELQAQYGPRVWQRSLDKWGENWRGNWIGSQYKTQISMPPITPSSHHEKLEAVLTLREFLRDKMPADKMEALLNEALHK